MKLKPEVNCWQCPKLCCYSLARPDVGFSHRSQRPSMCRHCDVISDKGCKIHTILHPTSRNCDAYTCYGVGNRIVDIFWLDPNEKAPPSVQHTFRQRQWIAHYLWHIKAFLKDHPRRKNLQKLREFTHEWESTILQSQGTEGISIAEFVSTLNTLMQEWGVWYNKGDHQFCFLQPS